MAGVNAVLDTDMAETRQVKRRRSDFSVNRVKTSNDIIESRTCEDAVTELNPDVTDGKSSIGQKQSAQEALAASDARQVNSGGTLQNHQGWLDAIRAATLRGSCLITSTETEDETQRRCKIERQSSVQYTRLLQQLGQLNLKQQTHAIAAHRFEQNLKRGKAAYGDLLYRYTELEQALKQRKQLLDKDQKDLNEELSQELHCQRSIRAIRVELEHMTTSGLQDLAL